MNRNPQRSNEEPLLIIMVVSLEILFVFLILDPFSKAFLIIDIPSQLTHARDAILFMHALFFNGFEFPSRAKRVCTQYVSMKVLTVRTVHM